MKLRDVMSLICNHGTAFIKNYSMASMD